MPKKLENDTIQLLRELSEEGLSPGEIAKRTGVGYSTTYSYTKALKEGYASPTAYHEHLIQLNGYATLSAYYQYLAKKRQQKPVNRRFSDIVKRRLTELGKTQKWLAEELGMLEGTVNSYTNKKSTPRKDNQGRVFNVLGLPYKTLDDMMK